MCWSTCSQGSKASPEQGTTAPGCICRAFITGQALGGFIQDAGSRLGMLRQGKGAFQEGNLGMAVANSHFSLRFGVAPDGPSLAKSFVWPLSSTKSFNDTGKEGSQCQQCEILLPHSHCPHCHTVRPQQIQFRGCTREKGAQGNIYASSAQKHIKNI